MYRGNAGRERKDREAKTCADPNPAASLSCMGTAQAHSASRQARWPHLCIRQRLLQHRLLAINNKAVHLVAHDSVDQAVGRGREGRKV